MMWPRVMSPFFAGALFGVGLLVSGMTRPAKVIAFLDVFSGAWDPSLAFVMGGALLVFAPLQRRVRDRGTPLFADIFQIPERRDLDPKLLVGAALFGVGWGLGGYCPGPGLTALASGGSAVVFVLAMTLGMWLHARLTSRPNRPGRADSSARPKDQPLVGSQAGGR